METHEHSRMQKHQYRMFMIMLAISFGVMYVIMLLGIDRGEHFRLNSMTTYMTLMMASSMAVVMLLLMRDMYKNKRLNAVILGSGVLVFCLSFWALRAETFVGDKQFLRSMIPHHSSAILMSEEAQLNDPEVRALADRIIRAQEEEIEEMKAILARMKAER
jgi:uncharacterized protein (DUF305 family)